MKRYLRSKLSLHPRLRAKSDNQVSAVNSRRPGTQWRITSEPAKPSVAMNLRSCRVTVSDLQGMKHTVEETASSLFEAVALGLTAIHEHEVDW